MNRASSQPGILDRDRRQLGLPETEPDPAGLARKLAAAPLKPRKPQAACDHGLFSDDATQTDLVEMVRSKSAR